MKLTANCAVALLLLFSTCIQAQTKLLSSGPEPSWITVNNIDYNNNRLNNEVEDGYLDLAFEKQVSLEEKSKYIKIALKILSNAGVQNASKITIDFDPAYQKLIFHSIRIIRNSSIIDKLQLSKIKTIQQEKDLDKHLYDGSLSAVLFLDDVRKGDVIEYSYTLKGENPVRNGKYADTYDTRYSFPICFLFYKLIVPDGRTVNIENAQTNVKPHVYQAARATAYEWRFNNVSSLKSEDNTPSWHDSYPMIMLSEYSGWEEINEWALSLYPSNVTWQPVLKSKIEELKKANPTDEKRIMAAVRFVQDEIRYMGIEMGPNSYKPHNPNQIIEQRFGDCKDKSYLLCTILKGMGIEANPVLINTIYKKTILKWLPSATIFDHVTVRIIYKDKYYFIDPTIMYQRGGIDDISYPNYEVGLVLTDTTRNLTLIPLQDKGMVKAKDVFKVEDMTGNAHLEIETRYTGSFADEMRSSYNSQSILEIQKSNTKFYNSYFENIKGDSLLFKENEETGEFVTTEYYTITKIWGADGDYKKVVFEPFLINEVIKKPKDVVRTMPFEIAYPAHYEEDIEVHLPEKWNDKEFFDEIKEASFDYSARYKCYGDKVSINYAYINKRDYVEPQELNEFLTNLKKVDDNWAYNLSLTTKREITTSSNPVSGTSGYSLLYTILGICVAITYIIRKNKARA